MKKNMVYFVLYIVILVELLIVITERDELQKEEHMIRDKMITSIAKMYKQPIILSIPQRTSDYNLKATDAHKVVLIPAGLVSDEEKEKVIFYIDVTPDSKKPLGWPDGGISSENGTDKFTLERQNGNAVFMADFDRSGAYQFEAYCEVERQLPGYLTPKLLEQLKAEVGEYSLARSQNEEFEVVAKTVGGVKKKAADIIF